MACLTGRSWAKESNSKGHSSVRRVGWGGVGWGGVGWGGVGCVPNVKLCTLQLPVSGLSQGIVDR